MGNKRMRKEGLSSDSGSLKESLVNAYHEREELFMSLHGALQGAFSRSAFGKGWDRHGDNLPFEQQDIVRECRTFGIAPNLFQIRKKARELFKFDKTDAQIAELQDIIVYAAGAIVHLSMESNPNKKGGEE